jgi:hypothetical protein
MIASSPAFTSYQLRLAIAAQKAYQSGFPNLAGSFCGLLRQSLSNPTGLPSNRPESQPTAPGTAFYGRTPVAKLNLPS